MVRALSPVSEYEAGPGHFPASAAKRFPVTLRNDRSTVPCGFQLLTE